MARIPLDPPRSVLLRGVEAYSRRKYGEFLDPAAAMGHNPKVLLNYSIFELGLARQHRVDKTLKALAVMAAAHHLGCPWCMDFGYWESRNEGCDPGKLRAVPSWRDSPLFSELERLVLEYAEAMSDSPGSVTDDLVDRLRGHLSDPQLVELSMMIAVENMRSRFNLALGLTSQGFSERCEVRAQ